MILITKCPHCQTSFKVTDDQLKLYDGAVRCGVCQQVFNGADHLQEEQEDHDLEPISLQESALSSPYGKAPLLKDEPKESKQPLDEEPPLTLEKEQKDENEDDDDDILLSLSEDAINAAAAKREALFNQLEQELSEVTLAIEQAQIKTPSKEEILVDPLFAPIPPKPTPQSSVSIQEMVGLTDSLLEKERIPFMPPPKKRKGIISNAPRLIRKEEAGSDVTPKLKQEPVLKEPSNTQKELHHTAEASHEEDEIFMKDLPGKKRQPAFMTRAKEKAQRGFFGSLFMAFVMFVLIAGIVTQSLYLFSDRIVLWMPSTEKMITGVCKALSCPRRLEAKISELTIETNDFQLIPELKNKYVLQLSIRNNAQAYQMWPHMELTLMDTEKKPTIRRVLSPADYLSDANRMISGLAPNTEEWVKVYFEMKDLPTTDYRVVLFYP